MAMLKHLDDGVGEVVGKLKQEGLFDNTILFILTDNGGSKAMSANNTPLRGFKSSLDEGGIRTPFIVSWPARFEGGKTVDTPVISFDILPTALDAIDRMPVKHEFDGKSLLPLMAGESKSHHDTLYWSKGQEDEWAVRQGDWKLHGERGQIELVNLADDPAETKNVAGKNTDVVKQLSLAFDKWIDQMADPITGGEKRPDVKSPVKPPTEREKERARIRASKKKQRDAEKKAKNAQAAERIGAGS